MKIAIRTSNINIDTTVPDSLQWINAVVQRLEIDADNNIESISPRELQLHRRVDKVVTDTVSVFDPVTGVTNNISVAGVGKAIELLMVKWMLEDNPTAYFDPETGRVILE